MIDLTSLLFNMLGVSCVLVLGGYCLHVYFTEIGSDIITCPKCSRFIRDDIGDHTGGHGFRCNVVYCDDCGFVERD